MNSPPQDDDSDDNWYHAAETLADMQKALEGMYGQSDQKKDDPKPEEKTFTIPRSWDLSQSLRKNLKTRILSMA